MISRVTPRPTMPFKILCCLLLFFVQIKTDDIPELSYLDTNANPCEDFYKFTCGNFKNVQPLPENETMWDNFAILQKEIFTLIKTILLTERNADEPVAVQKAKAAYQSCVDLEYVEQLDLVEKEVLLKLGGWPLIATVNKGQQKHGGFTWKDIGGIAGEYGISLLFTFSITQNLLNANENVILFSEDSLSDPTIRMAQDVLNLEKEVKFNSSAFKKFVKNIAKRLRDELGSSRTDKDIEADIEKVIDFTEKLDAGGVIDDDATYTALSTFVTIEALQNWTDTFFEKQQLQLNWLDYFNSIFKLSGVQVTNTTKIMRSASTDSIYGVLNLVRQTDPLVLKNFVIVRVLTYTAPDSDAYMRQAFEDYYLEQLDEQMQNRDEYCLYKVLDYPNIGLSLALAHEYQKYHFNINKLSLAAEMVQDLQNAFFEVIEESEWMDNSTKEAATNKAKEMITLLAYPDFVEDEQKLDGFYENLRVCAWDHFGNSQRLRAFSKALDYSAVTKDRDRELWNYSPLYTNALYSRQHNRMLFPIAMLNPTFFNGDIRVLDYSRIGAIIGHEITHGFDSTGRYYNHEGTYGSSWWTADAANTFNEKGDCFIKQYSQYYVEEIDAYVDGSLSLDENIADNGGLKDAYRAFKKLAYRRGRASLKTADNYTLDQLFFIGFGTMWCSTETEGYLNTIIKSKYAPARFRVNGAVSNMEEFAEAFSCPVGSKMNAADREKCSLW